MWWRISCRSFSNWALVAGVDEHRAEVDLDDAAFLGEPADHVVAHVPVPAGGEAATRGMGRDDRGLGEVQDLVERVVGDVRDVDHHADAVHPGDQVLAEGAQAVPFRAIVEGGVADVVVLRMRQGDVPHAAVVEMLDVVEVVFEGRAVLDAQEDRDSAAAELGAEPVDRMDQGELVRPFPGETLDHVDGSLGVGLRAALLLVFRRDVDRHEEGVRPPCRART